MTTLQILKLKVKDFPIISQKSIKYVDFRIKALTKAPDMPLRRYKKQELAKILAVLDLNHNYFRPET
jgi:hypothetical protein